jgi:hypothetical protein
MLKEESTGIVNRYIIPRLMKITSKAKMLTKLEARIKSLIPVAEGLRSLPLPLLSQDKPDSDRNQLRTGLFLVAVL